MIEQLGVHKKKIQVYILQVVQEFCKGTHHNVFLNYYVLQLYSIGKES